MTAWVKIPVLSNSIDTIIYMYYNSNTAIDAQTPSEVWSNGYSAVYHLNEISGGMVKDSGPNDHDVTVRGSPVLTPTGLSNAMQFDADSDIQLPNIPALHIGNDDFTVSGVMKFNSNMNIGDPPILGDKLWYNGNNKGYILAYENSNLRFNVGDGHSDRNDIFGGVVAGQWHYIVGVVDKDKEIKLYIDGIKVSNQDLTASIKNTDLNPYTHPYLGNDGSGSYSIDFLGILDEIRFSNVVRSDGWIKTEYENFWKYTQFHGNRGHKKYIDEFPIITLNGASPQIIERGSPYVNLGVTAWDIG